MKVKNPYLSNEISYKDVTNQTQLIRFNAIAVLLKDGLPEDKEDRFYLLNLLNSCDKTAILVKKLEGDITLSDSQARAFTTVSTVLNHINENPFIGENTKSLSVNIPEYEIIEGEDLIGIDANVEDILDGGD